LRTFAGNIPLLLRCSTGFFLKRMIRFLIAFLTVILLVSCGNGDSTNQPADDSVKKDDSLAFINSLIRKDPGNLDLYIRRARFQMFQKDYTSALADVDRVLAIDSNKAEYLLAGADINFFMGRVKRTQELLTRSVEVNPENMDCKLRLAQLNHYLTLYDEEMKLLDDVLRQDIHNAQAYFMKGMLFKEKGDTNRAISSMQTAVEQDPDYYNAYIQLGILHAARKNPLAESYYLNAIKVSPASEEAAYNLAMYYQEMEMWNRSIETYTSLLKMNPHHFDAHFNLGIIHAVKLNMTDQGMAYFDQAIGDNSKEPRGYYGRGYCFEKKGDINNARADYQMALRVDSTYTNAAMALSKLDKIK
jgi:tetratricopeptide (TPR) repeat protein